jgi:hypothetical protein
MLFTKAAKYLGVVIGPEAAKQAWDEPLQKYVTRSKRWAQLSIGLNWSIKMYNAFVFSVLSFMAQFYEPTPEVLKEEELALRRLMPGPRKWITKDQMLTLSTWGGFIRDPQSLQNVALVANTVESSRSPASATATWSRRLTHSSPEQKPPPSSLTANVSG